MQVHLRRQPAKVRQRLRDARLRVGGGFFEQGQVQVAPEAAVDVVQAAAEHLGGGQQLTGGGVHLFALGREGE
ncbi:hypothetical protein RZS08_05080, partial [Arthrospira platensis SPKY1]|nr:hypothetical protein [Arthrospira platensis SPKY1]